MVRGTGDQEAETPSQANEGLGNPLGPGVGTVQPKPGSWEPGGRAMLATGRRRHGGALDLNVLAFESPLPHRGLRSLGQET